MMQKDAEDYSLPPGIFSKILGRFFADLFDFFYVEFAKVPFYTKKFRNNNSGLVLRRQKKTGFSLLIPHFPKDMVGFKNS